MKRIEIAKLNRQFEKMDGQDVRVCGWVKSARDNKSIGFVDLNDGTCFRGVQIVVDASQPFYSEVVNLNIGSSVSIVGTIKITEGAKQPYEIDAKEVEIYCATDSTYPIQKKRQTVEYLRDYAYLRPRTNLFSALYRVRSELAFGIHEFFNSRGFVYAHTPIITSSDCEGAGNLFSVSTQDIYAKNNNLNPSDELMGKKAFLTPTGQLEGEAMAQCFGNIYTFGPTFRAENSHTTRHANEFWMIEPEMSFCDLDEMMDIEEDMIKFLIKRAFEKCPDEMNFFNTFVDKGLFDRLNHVLNSTFERVTYTEAIEILKKNNDKFEYPVEWGSDIQTEHERYLAEVTFKKPVFVTDYPKDIKAFYMKQNADGKTVRACDMLLPGVGETIGGSQREEDYDKLLRRIQELGLKESDYAWYLNLRKFGSVPHSGYGLGFDRLLMYVTGVGNIRDTIPFPRTPNNCLY